MRLKSVKSHCYTYFTLACSVVFSFTLNTSQAGASEKGSSNKSLQSIAIANQNFSYQLNPQQTKNLVASKLQVIPEAVDLVKNFEGFSSSAYIDTSGLPVIGYGQTRVNGQTVRLGQYITQVQANVALEQELYHIQQLVKSHVQVKLNPYQLGALTSLVFNAGTVILTDSTLIRKLNAGDYAGAAREFPRWNKANRGGQLVPFPGLTRRRLAEQKLFLTPYQQIASN